jgi:hypothetical protein
MLFFGGAVKLRDRTFWLFPSPPDFPPSQSRIIPSSPYDERVHEPEEEPASNFSVFEAVFRSLLPTYNADHERRRLAQQGSVSSATPRALMNP